MSSNDPASPGGPGPGQPPPGYPQQPPAYPQAPAYPQPPQGYGAPPPGYGPPQGLKTWHVTTAGVLTIVFAGLGALIGLLVGVAAAVDPEEFERAFADAAGQGADGVGTVYVVLSFTLVVVSVIGILGGILFLRRSTVGRVLTYIAAALSIPLGFLIITVFALPAIGIAIWVIVLLSMRPVRDWLNAKPA